MSIIYEALQKTHDERQTASLPQENMTRDDWIDVGISLVIAFLLATLMVAHYPQFNTKSDNNSIGKKTLINNAKPMEQTAAILKIPDDTIPAAPQNIEKPVDAAAFQSKHTLNGVYVSEAEKVAMVNNRFFYIGDNIDGMKVTGIELDKIKLENQNGIVELRVVG